MKDMRPTVVLRPNALLQPASHEHVESLLATATELCINQIDASSVHSDRRTDPNSEQSLWLPQRSSGNFTINTKVESDAQGRCPLNRGQIWQSVEQRLRSLGTYQADILYIHAPDSETLLEQQAAAMDDLYRQGRIKRLGLANFSIPMLQDYLAVCRRKSYTLPSVYLLTYNLLWRFPESKLIPVLRANGIALMVQSPLAGGLLTGRFAPEQLRLDPEQNRMYGRPCFHAAAADLVALVSPRGLSPAEAALRWLCWHSGLGGADGIVLGGDTGEQLRDNVGAADKGPLPEELVVGIESIWQGVREGVRR